MMPVQKNIFVLIIISCLVFSLSAQEKFNSDNAFNYIQQLCKPEFEARKTGLPGARKAAEWIGSQFQSWGLQPGGDNGAFIQEYPMIVTKQKKTAALKLKNGLFGSVVYQEGNDFTVYFNSGSGKINTEVVFVGFGISNPQKGWDDYHGIEVKGKIALIYRGTPKDGNDWSDENERDYKMRIATQHGAAGVIIFEARDWAIRGGTIHEEGYNPDMAAFNISKKVARDIFQGTYRNLDHTIRDLAKSPQSFPTGKMMFMEAVVEKIESGKGENVIGILPGSDPLLKDEFIVIGAHTDHNGISPDGHAYVGADDNASGTAVVMELARIFASRQQELKRSLVFIAFGGEEQGLRGSKYFTEHPTIPAEKICLMLNFDMEGQGDGGGGFGGRNYFPEIVSELVASLSDSVQKKLSVGRSGGKWGSDHAHFIEQGVPDFGFYSTGDHPFYHRIEDDPGQINPQSLQFVGDRASELLLKFANHPASLLFDGNKQGRTFLLFGDQVAFALDRNEQFNDEADLKQWIQDKINRGVSAVVLPLTGSMFSQQENYYLSIDEMNQWVKRNDRQLIRYQNGNSLNQAKSDGKIAIATGIVGSQIFQHNISALRNLSKLGLDFLCLNDKSDPMFEGSKLSAYGEDVLNVCQEGKIAIVWQIENDLLLQRIFRSYSGKVLIKKTVKQAAIMSDNVKEMAKQKNALLLVECNPEGKPEQLSELMDNIGVQQLYFSIMAENKDSNSDSNWAHRLMQELYENRMKRSNRNEVYKEMVKVLGENLKNFLK
jgi:hypothetical protein